ncbi:MAG: 5'/3'-nucleotidase SurE [Prevotella sp.]|nr:5'/3'-nucleotidase SurE [Prevotella sp.]
MNYELKKPLILISNDDGYEAKGIRSLVDMVKHLGDVVVCAPEGPRSGYSRAFSATTPLLLTKREAYDVDLPGGEHSTVEIWSCNGTPVDCVKMALDQIVTRRPDIVLGGINHGDNGSVNSHYSGTMGVVLEGCMKYIPSVAYSLCDHHADADFEPMRPYVERYTRQVLNDGLPKGVCLNINFPLLLAAGDDTRPTAGTDSGICHGLKEYKGVKVCRMAQGSWLHEISKCRHPREYDYYWMVGHYRNDEPDAEDTDNWALQHGYVAITPTTFDVTAYEFLKQKEAWEL